MSNKIFTATEIEILSMNPYVKKVSSKGITYTDTRKSNSGRLSEKELSLEEKYKLSYKQK